MIENRRWSFFVAVAEELHFTRAAERLRIAQPHLSQEIRKLEKELGVTLFARTKRRVALTPAGTVLLDRVRHLQFATEEAVRAAQRAERGETGSLSLSFSSAAAFDLAPRSLARYGRAYPDVDVVVEDLFSNKAVDGVLNGRVDLCIVHPPRRMDPSLQAEELYDEEMFAALPADHRLARGKTCSIEDLLKEPWILGQLDTGRRIAEEVRRSIGDIGIPAQGRRIAVRMSTLVCLVAGGLGVTLVPESAQRLGVDGVAFRPLRGRKIKVPVAIITRRDHVTPALETFKDIVRECAKSRRRIGVG